MEIGGSFLASTTTSLKFKNNLEFSTTDPQSAPLLSINVPIGLQFGVNPGAIQVLGNGQGIRYLRDPVIDTTFGLRVLSNQTLALIGGDISLEGAALKTAGGRIELGSVTGGNFVSLTRITKGFTFDYNSVQNFENIQLYKQAAVDASGLGGGDIHVWGGQITLSDDSQILANTLRAESGGVMLINAKELLELSGSSQLSSIVAPNALGTGGDLTINTRELLIKDGAFVNADTFGAGKGGNLTVNADSIEVTNTSVDGYSSSLSNQVNRYATGSAGDLTINTRELLIKDGAFVSTDTFGAGKGGNLTVNADSIEVTGITSDGYSRSRLSSAVNRYATGNAGNLIINTRKLFIQDGAEVSTNTFGLGQGGNLNVNADFIQLNRFSADGQFTSGLFTESGFDATGDAGNLNINTHELLIRDGAQVSTSTFGAGKGGDLAVRTDSVQVIGTSNDDSSRISTQVNSGATGAAGNLIIHTHNLDIQDGAQVSTATFDLGQGGNLTVIADSVQLSGRSATNKILSGLIAGTQGIGNAGDLSISTQHLLISDGAFVTVESRGEGKSGNLNITSNSIRLDNGKIIAQNRSGNGGNLSFNIADLLLMRRGSEISTTAGTAQQGGDGGKIKIIAPNGFIVAVPNENSDISANAYIGKGGSVNIEAYKIYGIEPRQNPTLLSDITASSELGVNGTIQLNTPGVDPDSGLFELPTVAVDTQIAQGCYSPGYAQSSFIITGRGGLPPNPREAFSANTVRPEWATLSPSNDINSLQTIKEKPPIPTPPAPIVEATGWETNTKGEIVLTANASTGTPHSNWQQSPVTCSSAKSASN